MADERTRERIRWELFDRGITTASELSETIGVDPADVERECRRLHRSGHLRIFGHSVYELTDLGEESLADEDA